MRMLKGLPEAGGLSGVKRLQMHQRAPQTHTKGSTQRNSGIIPPKPLPKHPPVGYEHPRPMTAGLALQNLASRRPRKV